MTKKKSSTVTNTKLRPSTSYQRPPPRRRSQPPPVRNPKPSATPSVTTTSTHNNNNNNITSYYPPVIQTKKPSKHHHPTMVPQPATTTTTIMGDDDSDITFLDAKTGTLLVSSSSFVRHHHHHPSNDTTSMHHSKVTRTSPKIPRRKTTTTTLLPSPLLLGTNVMSSSSPPSHRSLHHRQQQQPPPSQQSSHPPQHSFPRDSLQTLSDDIPPPPHYHTNDHTPHRQSSRRRRHLPDHSSPERRRFIVNEMNGREDMTNTTPPPPSTTTTLLRGRTPIQIPMRPPPPMQNETRRHVPCTLDQDHKNDQDTPNIDHRHDHPSSVSPPPPPPPQNENDIIRFRESPHGSSHLSHTTATSLATTISSSKSKDHPSTKKQNSKGPATTTTGRLLEVGHCTMSSISMAQRNMVQQQQQHPMNHYNSCRTPTAAVSRFSRTTPPCHDEEDDTTQVHHPTKPMTSTNTMIMTTTTTTKHRNYDIVNLCDGDDSHTDDDDNDVNIQKDRHLTVDISKNDIAKTPPSTSFADPSPSFSFTTSLSSDRSLISPSKQPPPSELSVSSSKSTLTLRQEQRRRQSQSDDIEEAKYVVNMADHTIATEMASPKTNTAMTTTTTTTTKNPHRQTRHDASNDMYEEDVMVDQTHDTTHERASIVQKSSSSSVPCLSLNPSTVPGVNNNKVDHSVSMEHDEEEKSSKSSSSSGMFHHQLPSKPNNQHIRFSDDDEENETCKDRNECSLPSSRKRRLSSSSGNVVANTRHCGTSPKHEIVLDGEDDVNTTTIILDGTTSASPSNKTLITAAVLDHNKNDAHTNQISDEPLSKRKSVSTSNHNSKHSSTAEAKSTVSSEMDYMMMVNEIENAQPIVSVPSRTALRATLSSQPSSWDSVTNVFQSVAKSTHALTSLVLKKVSSPNNYNDRKTGGMNSHTRTTLFNEGNRCKPPKMRKKFGLTHVIRPGEAIRSHDVPVDNAISEYYDDNDQYRCETRTRSLQPHSTVDVTDNTGTSRHPQSNSESSRKSLRTKETVNYDENALWDDSSDHQRRSSYSLRETKKRRSTSSVIEIDSSSDDDSLVDPKDVHPPKCFVNSTVEFETFRIAIGKQVFFNNCLFSFHLPSTKCQEATLELEYNRETRLRPKRSTYATRLSGAGDKSDSENNDRLHLINMTQDLLELKFYIPEHDAVVNASSMNDTVKNADRLTNNLLAMRVKTNADNGLNAFPNVYKPDSDIPERQWIVIELCTRKDMDDFISAMRTDLHLSVFAIDECRMSQHEAETCCQSLLKDNVMQEQQVHRENARAKSIGTFLRGKGQDDVLLVYPFGADSKSIDAASNGLKELSCVLEYENNNPSANSHDINATSSSKGNKEAELEENTTDDPIGEDSRAVLTLAVSTIERLEQGVYLNDTLIDFWQQWIWRNNDKSLVHYFTTLFFTTLEENDPGSVKRWTEKRGVDVFTKRFIFIPINKSLHWSFCVVVNPGAIMAHRKRCDSKTPDMLPKDDPFPCILFFDSLRAHAKNRFARLVRTWLNAEWKRLYPHESELSPFDATSMRLFTPKIPYQNNSWDCGVYVCRYMYAMYLLRSHKFTYAEVGQSDDNMFRDLITNNAAFRFGSDDIVRIRDEFMMLMERLSALFFKWKADDDRQRLETRRLKKLEETAINSKITETQTM